MAYTNLVLIGQGGFGKVYRANSPDGVLVAIKWIEAAKCPAQYAKGELRALKELSQAHPDRFVKYIGLVTLGSASPGDTCFAMEYCAHGSLYDYVRKNGRLGEQKALEVTVRLLNNLRCMHNLNLMHRDLKPQNVLITNLGAYGLGVKLADFGISKNVPANFAKNTRIGTHGYMAPQVLSHQPYGKEADVYSLGATLFYITTGSSPKSTMEFAANGLPQFTRDTLSLVPLALQKLISVMMNRDPGKRTYSGNERTKVLTQTATTEEVISIFNWT